jgi:Tfp pilus assembly protein PilF
MEFYERFSQSKALLDSALLYLSRQKANAAGRQNRDYIRAYYLLENYPQVITYAGGIKPAALTDAWSCYRIGEAYYRTGQQQAALPWYERAIAIMPYSLDFQNKYGVCQLALRNFDAAEKAFSFILKENPKYGVAAGNLGFVYMQKNQQTLAYEYLMRALALDPDHEQTLINLAVWLHGNNDLQRCRQVLLRLLKRHPGNEQAKAMLADLER